MEDVQSGPAGIAIPINRVGIRDVAMPLLVRRRNADATGEAQRTVASIDISVDLPAAYKGTHMSRFVEALQYWTDHSDALDYPAMKQLLEDICHRLNARRSHVVFRFPYFLSRPAPASTIPGLMRYVVFITAAVFLLDAFSQNTASAILYFDADAILHGEVWRLVTWLFIPEYDKIIWMVVGMFFYYFIGTAMESYWGTAKFTLFYLTGAVLTVAFAFLSRLWTPLTLVSNVYLNNILFLAFATLYPDALIRFYFVIPVKAKWLLPGSRPK